MTAARAAAVCLLLAGCGLVDSDLSTVRFELYPVTYALDTRQLGIPPGFWRLRCTPERNVCCEAIDCQVAPLVCRDQACVTNFRFEGYATVDLRAEAPALTRVGAHERAELYVHRLRYDVDNDLNLDLPALDLYLAPVGVVTSSHPQAQRFAVLRPTPKLTRLRAQSAEVLPTARELFARYARDASAFTLIVNAPIAISSAMPPLSGRTQMTVVIEMAGVLGQ